MTGTSALRERAALIDELRQIVQAMKNLAFAELQRVSRILQAQSLACDAVAQALRALPGAPLPVSRARSATAPVAWLVLGAERGFCGAFNARLAAELAALRSLDPQAHLLVASRRLYELLGTDIVSATAVNGCAAIEEADATLDAWMVMLAQEAPRCREVWLLYAGEAGIQRARLLPEPALEPGEEGTASPAVFAQAPMRYLPIPALRAALMHQAVRLLLQAGLYESLKQENHWRMTQMQRAQDHLDKLGHALQRRYAVLRQADITNELETLMSSVQGFDAFGAGSPLAATVY